MSTIDQAAVDALLARAHREVDEGLLPSCQLALGFEGEIVMLRDVRRRHTRRPATSSYSATKAFVAGAMWALIGDGSIDVVEPGRRLRPGVRHQRQGRRSPSSR